MPSALDLLLSRLRRDMENAEAPLRSQLVLVYETAIAELEHDLFNVTWLIEDALSRGEDITPDWLYRQDRYKRLIAKAETQLARFTDEALPLIEHTNLSGARLGARHAGPLLEAAGIQASFGTSINVPAVETIVQNMFRAGPIKDVLDSYGGNATAVIRHELAQGITLGKSPREVVRRIQDTLASGTNRARLTTLTRTEMMRSYRVAQGEHLEPFSHAIKAYRWSAALQSRTCLACLAMDGELFDEPQAKMHPNCRCICVPQGHYTPERYKRQSGAEWLAAQPEATQRGMFPSQASYEAYKRGELPLSAFVGEKHSDVWGTTVYQKSGKEALAGVGGSGGSLPVVPDNGFTGVDDAGDWFQSRGISAKFADGQDFEIVTEAARGIEAERLAGTQPVSRIEFVNDNPGPGVAASAGHDGYGDVSDDKIYMKVFNPNNTSVKRRTAKMMYEMDKNQSGQPWMYGDGSLKSVITHEYGHVNHYRNANRVNKLRKSDMWVMDNGASIRSNHWYGFDEATDQVARAKVSRYGQSSPMEFVAEVYSGQRHGIEFDDDVIDLYNRLGGP